MAVNPTYPGVYLTETAAASHLVTPATTNLTAFLGVFPQGSVDEAVLVGSWDQFESQFGGFGTGGASLAPYAVWQFFQNGGIGAWIVRLDATGSAPATATLGPLTITANSPGTWPDDQTLYVAFKASGGAAAPSTTHVDFVVQAGPDPTTAGAPAPARLETIPSLDTSNPAQAAQIITSSSQYVTAELPAAAAPVQGAPAATPPALSAATAQLQGGTEAAWDAAAFMGAVQTELGFDTTTPPAPPPVPRLDRLAPLVFNLMCIPDAAWLSDTQQTTLIENALVYCKQRQAFLIVDPPPPTLAGKPPAVLSDAVPTPIDSVGTTFANLQALLTGWAQNLLTAESFAGAAYYPWVQISDPANQDLPKLVPPSGTIAGVYAATDEARGVWKAPAGVEAVMQGVTALADNTITDTVNGELNVAGINVLRTFPLYGNIVWGSRTLAGSDVGGSPFKYVPVRRLSDFIEQSLQQSLRWAVFEPNAAPLWAAISIEVTQFMTGLFAQGAFGGATAAQAFTVTCDATTTSAADMLRGIVNVNVGFQPVDPAEFVVVNVQIETASVAAAS